MGYRKDGLWDIRCKHNLYGSPTYRSWNMCIQHCHNRKNSEYRKMRQLKIQVCKSWRNSFMNFLKDMGVKPEGTVLARIDLMQGFNKKNCRWMTRREIYQLRKKQKEQMRGRTCTSWDLSYRRVISHFVLKERFLILAQ